MISVDNNRVETLFRDVKLGLKKFSICHVVESLFKIETTPPKLSDCFDKQIGIIKLNGPLVMGPFFYGKMGSWVLAEPNCPKHVGAKRPRTQSDSMILFVSVDLKQVSCLGRNFPWKKPVLCPCCEQSHVWGMAFQTQFLRAIAPPCP